MTATTEVTREPGTIGRLHHIEDVRGGYEGRFDAIVVGSGPGGFVTADNLAAAGMKVALVEAGPQVTPAAMTEEAPFFLAKHYWEGGLRLVAGNCPNPVMMGRGLGGSSIVNSAIMLKLPESVRSEWVRDDHLGSILRDAAFDRAFDRVFARTKTTPTPMTVLGRRNELVRDALEAMGIEGKPLPRAVEDCQGCGDCITGCHEGRKQSADRAYGKAFLAHGGQIFTCSHVDEVLVEGGRAVGVKGRVIDIDGWRESGRFTLRAPKVFMAAGVGHTPVILKNSGLSGGGLVGESLYVHLTGGGVAIMDERVDPWHGATQGWGAFSNEIPGLKYEALWAAPSLISVNWGGMGLPYLRELEHMKHAAVFALVYKGRVTGKVRRKGGGLPHLQIHVPDDQIRIVMRGQKAIVDGFLKIGARWVHTTTFGVPEKIRNSSESEQLLSPRIKPRDCHMTFNHMFGSCRMSGDPKRGPVDASGALRGVSGVWVTDASIFPGPSAVNPQATIMALADVISRRVAGLPG
jgi:choline dehydrogenase-like flavoprotein